MFGQIRVDVGRAGRMTSPPLRHLRRMIRILRRLIAYLLFSTWKYALVRVLRRRYRPLSVRHVPPLRCVERFHERHHRSADWLRKPVPDRANPG